MQVAVGSLVFAGGPGDSGTPGFYLAEDGLADWDAVPESKSEIRERPQAEGAFAIENDWRKSLPFSVKGVYLGESRADVQAAKRLVKGSIARGKSVPVVVTDADGPKRRTASVRAVIPYGDSGGNEFGVTIELVAFDPRMYGPDQVLTAGVPSSGGGLLFPLGTTPMAYWDFGADGASGRVQFTNDGTAPTSPILTATGGLSGGFTATDVTTGQIVKFERVIPAGSIVQINQRTGRAWIDSPGNDVSGYLTGRDFFMIGPGETHQIQFAPIGVVTGTPQFSMVAASADL